jgi:hypothetical protein
MQNSKFNLTNHQQAGIKNGCCKLTPTLAIPYINFLISSALRNLSLWPCVILSENLRLAKILPNLGRNKED